MTPPIDVLVVGGGPVGLATALHARAAGLRVEVLEARAGPVDKACGEGLMPGAVAALARLGIDPGGMALHGVRYVSGAHRAEARFPGGPGRGVRRPALQRALATAATDAGIPVHRERAGRIRVEGAQVSVGGRAARFVVGADGLHSTVRRAAGLHLPSTGTARFGLRQHFRAAPWTDLIEVHWADGAEAYVTPVGRDEVGVAVLSAQRRPWAEQLAAFPGLLALLGDAEPVSALRGAGPLHQRASAAATGRVALVGDAAGYLDALTGEGLSLGLAAAEALAAHLAAGRLDGWTAAHRRLTRRSRALTRGLLAATQVPALRRALVPAAAALPSASRGMVRLLAS